MEAKMQHHRYIRVEYLLILISLDTAPFLNGIVQLYRHACIRFRGWKYRFETL